MTDRISDDELTALLAAHRKFYADCNVCRVAWPCETVRLATEVRDLRAVLVEYRDKAEVFLQVVQHPSIRASAETVILLGQLIEGFQNAMTNDADALVRYEEGGR